MLEWLHFFGSAWVVTEEWSRFTKSDKIETARRKFDRAKEQIRELGLEIELRGDGGARVTRETRVRFEGQLKIWGEKHERASGGVG